MVQIVPVQTKAQLKKFIKFANDLYKDSPYYVHPLNGDELMWYNPKKSPVYENVILQSFLAYKDNKIAGRITVMVQKLYNEKHNGKFARFTRFDFINDEEVARALITAAEDWARLQGMDVLHGPLGFTDVDKEGMLIEGFDKLSTFETIYNYDYYPVITEKLGFKKEADWFEYCIPIFNIPKESTDRYNKMSDLILKRYGFTVAPQSLSIKDLIKLYGDEFFSVINEAFAPLHGVVPITPKVKDMVLKQFMTYLRREYVCLVLDKDGKLVGLSAAMASIAKSINKCKGKLFPFGFIGVLKELKKPETLDLLLIGIRPEHQNKGINAVLINEIIKSAVKNGIKRAETNLELEDNEKIHQQSAQWGREQIKRRRCYAKKL